MAYQTGNIKYRGSFKSIRQWKNAHDPKIYAGEKGGANRDLILNNPTFARTRENMNEFEGCGIIVKAIRIGLQNLISEHTDTRFTARLVSLVKKINVMDIEGERGKRAIRFSLNMQILRTLTLQEKKKIDFQLKRNIRTSHPQSRNEATITVKELNPNPLLVPATAEYYRVLNHLSIISDYVYDETCRDYKPLNPMDKVSVFAYSDYTPVNTSLNAAIKVAFPDVTMLTETATVLQCVGIEYYIKSRADKYLPFNEGSMMVFDVF
jgi:hypothetical protein